MRARVEPAERPATPAAAPAALQRPGLLQLQRAAGNAAVRRLLARKDTPKKGETKRAAFERVMRDRYGVGSVRAGTEADLIEEMRRSTPEGQTVPSAIKDFVTWNPGPDHALYADLQGGFEDVARVFGGTPEVREIRFLEADYENNAGTAERKIAHGAFYSAGLMAVFKLFEIAAWSLAEGVSTEAGGRANVASLSPAKNRRRIIIHELGHGIAERAMAADSTTFDAFRKAGGWVGDHIEQDGATLTKENWNSPWSEQPMSKYSLANPAEDFAETILAYVEMPDVLKGRSPARHAFVESRKAAWAAGLRAPT